MSTAELMEIVAFITKSKTQTIPDLEKRLVQAKDELLFLLDNIELPPADLRLNTSMFSWIERMPAAFDEHATIIKEKTEQFKDALTVMNLFSRKEYFSSNRAILLVKTRTFCGRT